jgi:hypothetical protein
MKYGYIINISNSEELYFINYIDENIIKLIDNNFNIREESIKKLNISTIKILYKPFTSSYIVLNDYRLNEVIFIKNTINNDNSDNLFKIKKLDIKNDLMEVTDIGTNKDTIIKFSFKGLPKNIIEIRKFNFNSAIENNISNDEVDDDTDEYIFYYSIDQKINFIIEDLVKYSDKTILKTVNRYKELVNKYYNINNEYVSIQENEYKTKKYNFFIGVTDDVKLQGYNSEESKYPIKDNEYFDREFYHEYFKDNIEQGFNSEELVVIKKGNNIINDEVYLFPGDLLYIKLSNPIKVNISSVINKDIYRILYDIHNSDSSSILIKSISKPKYINNDFLTNYESKNINSIKNDLCKSIIKNNYVYNFDDTINIDDYTPDTSTLIKCISNKFYNLVDAIQLFSFLHISEIKKEDYYNIIKNINKNLDNYTIYNETLPIERTKHNKHIINDIIDEKYKSDYYTDSELYSLIDKDLYSFLIKKKNIVNSEINNYEADTSLTISKYYKNKSEMNNDTNIILKDEGTKYNYSSTIIHIYNNFTEYPKNIASFITEFNNGTLQLDNLEELTNKYRIKNGDIAYVIDDDKMYFWNINLWDDNITEEQLSSSRILEGITSNYNNLITEYSDEKLSEFKNKTHLKSLLKYNLKTKYVKQKKKYLSNDENIYSPHLDLFNLVLNEKNLENSMKLLRLFIDKYTMINEDDIHWLYCNDSGFKLVPMFYRNLVIAYEKSIDDYNKELTLLCHTQGKQVDNIWVDKYSGYKIDYINFDNDEGYTKDGFKINTREVLVNNTKKDIFVSKEDNIYYENIILIFNTINVELEAEDITLLIDYIKNSKEVLSKVIKKTTKDNLILGFSIITTIFFYIQTFKDYKNISSYYKKCKASFEGYPIEGDTYSNDPGINYIICIIENIKGNIWNNFKKNISKNFEQIIKILLDKSTIGGELLKRKEELMTINKKNELLSKKKTIKLFLPRLSNISFDTKTLTLYQGYFYVQYLLNKNTVGKEKLNVNSSYIKYVYLDDNYHSFDRKRIKESYNTTNLFYYKLNTKNNYYKLDEHNLNHIIIKQLNKSEDFNSKSTTDKELYVNDMGELEMNNILYKKFKPFVIKEEKDKIIDNSIHFNFLLGINLFDKETMDISKITEIEEIFNNIEYKIFPIIDENYDYYTIYNYERIINICSYYNQKMNNYNPYKSKLKTVWNISDNHKNDIYTELLHSNNIIGEIIRIELPDIDVNMYRMCMNYIFTDESIGYKISCILLYNIIKDNEQLRGCMITKYNNEYKYIDNNIKIRLRNKNYESELEKETITEAFKNMTTEERHLENKLKDHRLNKWSKGLSDNMYKYTKDAYDADILENIIKYTEEMEEGIEVENEAYDLNENDDD